MGGDKLNPEDQVGGAGAAAAAGTGGADEDKEEGSSYKHRLSNVNFINMGHLQKIKCVVDNQVCW